MPKLDNRWKVKKSVFVWVWNYSIEAARVDWNPENDSTENIWSTKTVCYFHIFDKLFRNLKLYLRAARTCIVVRLFPVPCLYSHCWHFSVRNTKKKNLKWSELNRTKPKNAHGIEPNTRIIMKRNNLILDYMYSCAEVEYEQKIIYTQI